MISKLLAIFFVVALAACGGQGSKCQNGHWTWIGKVPVCEHD